jgi:hypothetical protein
MKTKLIVLLTGWILFSISAALAQTKPAAAHKRATHQQNFKVCKNEAGYYICPRPGDSREIAKVPALDTIVETAASHAGWMPRGAGESRPAKDICRIRHHNEVCRINPASNKISCYKTKHAYNFNVCKNEHGYYICCEAASWYNSTYISEK